MAALGTLTSLDHLDEKFKGNADLNRAEYHVQEEDNDEQHPFKCILDVGLGRTTVGARMWAALKVAVDGGPCVPTASNCP